jgi:hypothetical protein
MCQKLRLKKDCVLIIYKNIRIWFEYFKFRKIFYFPSTIDEWVFSTSLW